jgi:hypothetical protein
MKEDNFKKDNFEKEFIINKTTVLYRGNSYKVKGIKKMIINDQEVILLRLPHNKYNFLVNAENVIKC